MNRLIALTLEYSPVFDEYLAQSGIEHSTGKCPFYDKKVVWIENYDKSIYDFIVSNDINIIANFKAYYFDSEIISVNEKNYKEHINNLANWERNILSEWLPKEEEI